MKITTLILPLFFSLFFSCSTKGEKPPAIYEDSVAQVNPLNYELDSLDKVKAEAIQKHVQGYVDQGQFSGAILVAQGHKVLFKGGFGWADVENKISNEANTRFLIGSTTKSFTAIALLLLEQDGLVDLDKPISQYLPNLRPDFGAQFTLDILLRMKSGLPNHLKRLTSIEDQAISTDEIINIINSAELAYEPGTQYSYSNLNYHLIGAIIEKVSGMSYAAFLQQRVFESLQMFDSGTDYFDTLSTRYALGYHVGSLDRTEKNNLFYALGSGNIYSTVEDIYKWDQALYNDHFINKENKAKAFKGGSEDFGYYGYGFRIREYTRADSTLAKGTLVRHGGTMMGYLANVHRYLDDRVTVIVLGNISMFPIRDLTTELKEIALGMEGG